ncbi:hypothetical protein CPB84DRAFT_1962051 [Gymnopilus junonius]|uniref:AB hydrolase-1 domain-containing protein n=1 Tax=Gymnopilus junonius TaxID=109634 RepID=A0A9P5NPM5_GYMJU|nr:hypothetical protein CPB84DRAFT_1962051 [Gymnopilus junonius]
MRFLLPLALASSAFIFAYGYGPQPRCQQATIPVKITARPRVISLSPPKNQSELTGIITNLTSTPSNFTTNVVHGQRNLTATYDIWTLLCLPPNANASTVEFTIHGSFLDHTYWNFGGEGSPYNYADVALNAGHAVFLYDRLGAGKSSKPNGIEVLQEDTEIEIAAELIKYIRRGRTGHHFQQIIGIGHSYGSLLLTGIAAKYGNLLNVTILTGFTPYTGAFNTAVASFGLKIAAEQDPSRFGSLSNSYMTISNEQAAFFYFPHFDPNILRLATKTKDTATLGQLLTLSARVATNYTNSVFVVTGAEDFIYCGGNCYQSFAGFNDLVLSSDVLFPNAWLFSWAIPANTGHVVNFHYGAPQIFKMIQLWISDLTPNSNITGGN